MAETAPRRSAVASAVWYAVVQLWPLAAASPARKDCHCVKQVFVVGHRKNQDAGTCTTYQPER